jgi:nicotinamide-nucleotide amidase
MSEILIPNETLKQRAGEVVSILKRSGYSVVTAESCTAGLLAALLSKAEGAGEVLKGGFVCYSKDHKSAALGVPERLLEEKTAVAAEVAGAMAKGALARSNAYMALSVTGVLGPAPDEDGNPVGLVFIALHRRTGEQKVVQHDFGMQEHEALCAKTLSAALDLLVASA